MQLVTKQRWIFGVCGEDTLSVEASVQHHHSGVCFVVVCFFVGFLLPRMCKLHFFGLFLRPRFFFEVYRVLPFTSVFLPPLTSNHHQ